MRTEDPAIEFKHWMEVGALCNALRVAEEHLPEKVGEAAEAYYDMWMKQKAYCNALDIAKKHLPHKVNEAAEACYDMWMKEEAYGNALAIAKKHFPERVKRLALRTINSNLEVYESLVMMSDPSKKTGDDVGNLTVADLILTQVRALAGKYLDQNGMICYDVGNGIECGRVLLEERIAEIQSRAKERLKDPVRYQLDQNLREAVEKEDYETAAQLRDRIQDLSK